MVGFDYFVVEFVLQVVDVDFDDVGIVFGFVVVQMFGQVFFGQDLVGVQYEIVQQVEFGGGQVDVGVVQVYVLVLFVQVQFSGFQLVLVGQFMGVV